MDPVTREKMSRIDFRHGGAEYDARYPDGIPTTLQIEHRTLGKQSSGLVMYPEGHARNASGNLPSLLEHKFRRLAGLGVRDADALLQRLTNLGEKSADEVQQLYSFEIEPPGEREA
jgi:2-methylcitrate dehydratase